jgi:hypothetical protein
MVGCPNKGHGSPRCGVGASNRNRLESEHMANHEQGVDVDEVFYM